MKIIITENQKELIRRFSTIKEKFDTVIKNIVPVYRRIHKSGRGDISEGVFFKIVCGSVADATFLALNQNMKDEKRVEFNNMIESFIRDNFLQEIKKAYKKVTK